MSGPTFRRRPRPGIGAADTKPADDLASEQPLSEDNYRVGYKRPPIDTRFGGKRGNRSGRKKGSKTLDAALTKELKSKVEVMVGGRVRRLSKLEVLALNTVNSAIAGKTVSQRLVFDYLHRRAEAVAARETTAVEDDQIELSDGEAGALRVLTALLGFDDSAAGEAL